MKRSDQLAIAHCGLEGRQVGPPGVFQQHALECPPIRQPANDDGHLLESGAARGLGRQFANHDLIVPGDHRMGPDQDRMLPAGGSKRARQALDRLLVVRRARPQPTRMQLLRRYGSPDEGVLRALRPLRPAGRPLKLWLRAWRCS